MNRRYVPFTYRYEKNYTCQAIFSRIAKEYNKLERSVINECFGRAPVLDGAVIILGTLQ